jgi:hypothetical protein
MDRSIWKEKAQKGLERLAGCPFENFMTIHGPPYRSLNNGATGIAYTFWKAACILDDPHWLHHARYWIDHTIHLPQDEQVVGHAEDGGNAVEIEVEESLYHGDRGVQFVKMLVSYAQADDYHLNKYLKQLERPSSGESKMPDLLQNIPGRLVGFAILYDEMGYSYLEEAGELIARQLIGTADCSSSDPLWGDNHYLGMAHGRGGILYSLLFWAKIAGNTPPDRIYEAVRAHAAAGERQEHGLRWPIDERRGGRYLDSWCHGTPGQLQLFSLAYELCDDPLFLETAREAGMFLIHREDYRLGHLCCGAAGAAYALLSLNRIDPDGPWLEHAGRYALMAETAKPVARFRLGLYTGMAGVVCLMLDMIEPPRARQPAFQG